MEEIVMRKARGASGQMRIIEALLASFLILFAIAFVNLFALTPASQTYEAGELEKVGFNVLHDLDEQRLLGRYIQNKEWANFTAALTVSLPTDVYFNLTVYDLNWRVVNTQPISYGTAQVFSSSFVASVTYVVPGYGASYSPKILVLQLVRG